MADRTPSTSREGSFSPPEKGTPFDFIYHFRSNGTQYRLRVPLGPSHKERGARELALRLIQAHNLPCYLEEELSSKLERHVRNVRLQVCDEEAEEKMQGGSVFEKGSDTEQVIDEWVTSFSEHNSLFSPSPSLNNALDREAAFSEAYHKLIHSQTLETLLQLEHTYAFAVSEVCRGRENAMEVLQARHENEVSEAMKALDTTHTEKEINLLMRQHAQEREAIEKQWSEELSHMQDTQRREYREWVLGVYRDSMATSEGTGKSMDVALPKKQSRVHRDSDHDQIENSFCEEDDVPPLQESFTIYLGAQQKRMYNLRLLCGDPLDLCRHKTPTFPGQVVPHPERLQTAMSLYSSKLSALILLVDDRISTHRGIKEAFAKVCQQSTDFHFPDISLQLQKAQEFAATAVAERKDRKFTTVSMSSQNSESQLSSASLRSESPTDTPERGVVSSTGDLHTSNSGRFLSPPHPSPAHASSPTRPQFTLGPPPGESGNGHSGASPSVENDSLHLEPGDFYVTRHSNLSQVHVMFHLVTDDSALLSTSLRARHPVITGLKNCLRAAARHDVHHITIPLLLAHHMKPEMTISWCLKRAELVMKCVKGFMLENTAWGEGESRTIQFLAPKGISSDVFEEFCDMLPRIFRVATTRVFTTTRTAPYRLK